jgi:hypothetical protein
LPAVITGSVPALLESIVALAADDLGFRPHSETQQSANADPITFQRGMGDEVSDRIAGLEKVLLDQAAPVTALSHRAIESG